MALTDAEQADMYARIKRIDERVTYVALDMPTNPYTSAGIQNEVNQLHNRLVAIEAKAGPDSIQVDIAREEIVGATIDALESTAGQAALVEAAETASDS